MSKLGITASGIAKAFRGTPALIDAGVAVEPGSLVALTGANGAGKTTLLRVLATLVVPDAGTASIAGHDVVSDAAAARRAIGVALVGDRGVYWRLSGAQNLAFFARVLGMDARTARARAAEMAARMGIEEFADRPAGSYSTGQRQRLILARAMLGAPDALLVDEPMRGLDDEGIMRIREALRAEADRGAAVLVAGPTIGEFADLCDEIFVLHAGRLAERIRGKTFVAGHVAERA